jgi:hypothetical protein
MLIRRKIESNNAKIIVFIFRVRKVACVHNFVPGINIAINSSRHRMSEKMKIEKNVCHF